MAENFSDLLCSNELHTVKGIISLSHASDSLYFFIRRVKVMNPAHMI